MKNWAVPERLPVVVTGAASAGSDGFSPRSYTLTTLRKREVGDALTKLSWCGELGGSRSLHYTMQPVAAWKCRQILIRSIFWL